MKPLPPSVLPQRREEEGGGGAAAGASVVKRRGGGRSCFCSETKHKLVLMGNSDSHSGLVAPVKSSSVPPSARSWWRSSRGGGGGGGKGRSRGRSYWSNTSASGPPYSSWHYEHAPGPGPGPPAEFITGGFSFLGNGGERRSVGGGGSPKVLLSKDGSMRVEFTNIRGVTMETQEVATITPSGVEPSLRTSKGSSLSSDGSWYDSPWGGGGGGGGEGEGGEMSDNTFVSSGYNTFSSTRTQEEEEDSAPGGSGGYGSFFSHGFVFTATDANMAAAGFTSCSSARTEDSSLGDSLLLSHRESSTSLDYVSSLLPSFPTAPDASSSSSIHDVIQEEEEEVMVGGRGGGVEQRFSSLTLPCRTSSSSASISGNSRKDFLKSRIRRLSDWTGSLSRKKRRIQEPYGSQVDCTTLWSFNPLHSLNQEQVQFSPPPPPPAPALHCGSSRDLDLDPVQERVQSLEAQRQNIYQNFMQDLETGRSSTADRTEASESEEEEGEEEEEEEEEEEQEEEQGVVRRAGWLSFKALLSVSLDRKLEMASRRKWKHYWVTLRGCTLLFYDTCGTNLSSEQDVSPRYSLAADDSLVQSVPEHPKREFVFCLSNRQGDVYLFQATSQTDLENWVTSIHSASAALLARREGTEETLRLLRRRCRSLLTEIDSDAKMKKMAELQLSVIRETKSRKAVESQIQQWEQNLEKLHLDLFRFRCYLSSLQGGELPNPKSLLATASRPSKSMLGRLGVFSVSSFHALVCSRDEEVLQRRRLSGGGGVGRRSRRLPSSLRELQEKQRCNRVSRQEKTAPPAGHSAALQVEQEPLDVFTLRICRVDAGTDFGFAVTGHVDGLGKSHVFVSEVDQRGLSFREGLRAGDEVLAVNGSLVSGLDLDLLQSLFSDRELLLLLRRHRSHDPESRDPGEPPAAVVWPDPADPCDPSLNPLTPLDQQTPSTESDSLPGLHNDSSKLTEDLELQLPNMGALCWVLPLEEEEEEEVLEVLEEVEEEHEEEEVLKTCCLCRRSRDQLLLLSVERLYSLYQTFPEGRAAEVDVPCNPYREAGLQTTSPAHLSRCQRLRRVIEELVTTEKSYVKDLVCLFDLYLTPLQQETFLSKDEMEALFGCLPEMLDFQRVFLQTLEERINSCPNSSSLETPAQLKKLLFSLGGSFLYYADHFKHYSGFCANHSKVQKVLERAKTDAAFKHFLDSRNPTNQHSASLESYLIKPVQRVLKYPLLLRELVYLTDPQSPEHTHLTEALRAMEKVASHINEMQKIYEDYGCVFDQLTAEHSGQVTEISMGEFLIHSSVVWLNPLQSLGRLRKDPQLTVFVFKRAVILVYRENKLKKRMTRSADLDPFRFRWLIPVSEVQVRAANITGSESLCAWELVHNRSEVEGRPETVFQLRSSSVESKASVLRALRLLLRERPSSSSGSLRRTRLSTAERSSSWRRRQQQRHRQRQGEERLLLGDTWGRSQRQEEQRLLLGDTCSEPLLPSRLPSDLNGKRSRLCSLTGDLEAQLQRLNFSEEEEAERGEAGRSGEERKRGSSLRRSTAGDAQDVNSLLERDFSVQSLTSIINEDCFYDNMKGIATAVTSIHG